MPLLVMLKPTTFPEVNLLSSTSLWLMSSSSSSSSQWSVKMCLPKSRGLENATEQIEQGNFPSSSDIFEIFFLCNFLYIKYAIPYVHLNKSANAIYLLFE